MRIIKFYKTSDSFGEFSNFSKHGVIDEPKFILVDS